jgi:pilus assembly protein CpaC
MKRPADTLKSAIGAAALVGALLAAAAPAFADQPLAGAPRKGREAATARLARKPIPAATVIESGPAPDRSAPADQTVKVDLGSASNVRMLSIPRGKSAVIELPVDAGDVIVTDPKITQAVLSTRRRIFLLGQASGQTDAAVYDSLGRQILRLNIRVDQDVAALAQTLNQLLPGAQIRVESVNDNIILSGVVSDALMAEKAVKVAQGFVAKPENIINMMSVAGRDQVMLKVRVVEVNRTVIKQLGFNLSAVTGQSGLAQMIMGVTPTFGVNGSLQGGLNGGYNLDTTKQPEMVVPCGPGLSSGTCNMVQHGKYGTYTYYIPQYNAANQIIGYTPQTSTLANGDTATLQTTAGSKGLNQAKAMVEAFESAGLVRTLAEPTLAAISGESAKFLAGGEFPVPVARDALGAITVEYKQYGVGLGFTPIVLGPGRISLKVSTEVSQLNNTGGFTLTSTSTSTNLTIPSLTVRRVETSVELPSGGSMMLAGLLQNTTQQTLASLPGLLQLPVLGPLFRSRDFLNNESELVVIITPYIVKPTTLDRLSTPADGLVIASDTETTLLGSLNKASGKGDAAPKDKTYQGPFGYVVD